MFMSDILERLVTSASFGPEPSNGDSWRFGGGGGGGRVGGPDECCGLLPPLLLFRTGGGADGGGAVKFLFFDGDGQLGGGAFGGVLKWGLRGGIGGEAEDTSWPAFPEVGSIAARPKRMCISDSDCESANRSSTECFAPLSAFEEAICSFELCGPANDWELCRRPGGFGAVGGGGAGRELTGGETGGGWGSSQLGYATGCGCGFCGDKAMALLSSN